MDFSFLAKILDSWPFLLIVFAITGVGSYGFYKHAIKHTDGSDDIQTADAGQKGLMSSTHHTDLETAKSDLDIAEAAIVAIEADIVALEIDVLALEVDVAAIESEIIAARGSKASVDARLDVELNEDGTLKGGGWIKANETWTYASATTFTISGDKTGKYQKGDKLKLTQTTVKYFYVVSTTYADTITTITVTGGSDYSLADAAISANYYSKTGNPQGFPHWFNWTPSSTGFAGSPNIYTGKFCLVGNTCTFAVNIQGTSNAPGFTFTAPINPNWTSLDSMIAVCNNGTWQNTPGVIRVQTDGTTDVGITFSTMGGSAYDGFTSSGNKGVIGYHSYGI